MHSIILCRSMTYAQRAMRVLQTEGIFASVTKAPQSANPHGCTYGVKIGDRNLYRALPLLQAAGIPIGKVFQLDERGNITEVET